VRPVNRAGAAVMMAVAMLAGACSGAPEPVPGPSRPESSASASTTRRSSTRTSSTRRVPSSAPRDTAPSEEEGAFQDDGVPGLGAVEVDVEHYDIDLDYEPSTRHLRSQTTLTLVPRRELAELRLDYRGPAVTAATVDGEAVETERTDDRIAIRPLSPLPEGREVTVSVSYEGTPDAEATEALRGVRVGWHSEEDGSFVLSEPDGASTWFPNNNHPRDKATYDMSVKVPNGYTAIANGVLEGQDESNGATTYHWVMHQPMASYLATVVTGRFIPTASQDVDGVPMHNYVPESGEPPRSFRDQPEDMSMLVERLGPFPFSAYGSVQLPESFFGDGPSEAFLAGAAFEAQGRSLFGANSTSSSSVVHELAHQWMGDNVTVTDWSRDIWWVEGFAHYAEWVRDEVREGPAAYAAAVEGARRQTEGRTRVGRRPTATMFDETTYVGGALVFADLRAEVGDDTFWKILRTFNERFRHANATTADLVAVASEVSGQDLAGFFATQLR